jgi:hypothetical protein
MAKRKVKPITAGELAGMSHSELATVKTKRRITAALRRGEKRAEAAKDKPKQDEQLTPRQRLARAHEARDPAVQRRIRRGEFETTKEESSDD